jgi:predicted PurR-regulated permease PerM
LARSERATAKIIEPWITADRPNAGIALRGFAVRTRRYVVVTTVFGLIVAVLDTIALAVLSIPLAVLWGLVSFVTNYILNVGFLLGLLPPALRSTRVRTPTAPPSWTWGRPIC